MTTAVRRRNRRGQGGRLRDDLLDAAADLVAEAGDARDLSLRSVAAKAGVAATSVYLHFPDLAALRDALAQRCFAGFGSVRDAASAGIDDPARALLVRSRAYVRYALDHPGWYRLMFDRDVSLPTAPSASRNALDALAESIARCQHAGVARTDAEPARLAVLVWTALHGQASLRIDRPAFPWPELDPMIDELVGRIAGLDQAPR